MQFSTTTEDFLAQASEHEEQELARAEIQRDQQRDDELTGDVRDMGDEDDIDTHPDNDPSDDSLPQNRDEDYYLDMAYEDRTEMDFGD